MKAIRLAASGLLALIAALAPGASTALAQSIEGRITESSVRRGLAGVELSVSQDGRAVGNATTSDSGTFAIRVPAAGEYRLDGRKVGYLPIIARVVRATGGVTMIEIEMERLSVQLDTVRTTDRNLSKVTTGSQYVRAHLALGKGIIVSGFDIQRSGMLLSEYLGKLDGVALRRAPPPYTPVLPGRNGFLTGDGKHNTLCLYGRINHVSPLHILMQKRYESLDDILDVREIMAVEIYRNVSEIPREWRQEMVIENLYLRRNMDMKYTIGHPGAAIPYSWLMEDHFAMEFLFSNNRFSPSLPPSPRPGQPPPAAGIKKITAIPQCGFMQIWTRAGWE